jgi:hypothetical protein
MQSMMVVPKSVTFVCVCGHAHSSLSLSHGAYVPREDVFPRIMMDYLHDGASTWDCFLCIHQQCWEYFVVLVYWAVALGLPPPTMTTTRIVAAL